MWAFILFPNVRYIYDIVDNLLTTSPLIFNLTGAQQRERTIETIALNLYIKRYTWHKCNFHTFVVDKYHLHSQNIFYSPNIVQYWSWILNCYIKDVLIKKSIHQRRNCIHMATISPFYTRCWLPTINETKT